MGKAEAVISARLSTTYSCFSVEVGEFVNVHGKRTVADLGVVRCIHPNYPSV